MANLINEVFKPILERLPENNRLERIWILAKVDFKKRFYDSGLGLFWALLRPLMMLCVYMVAFEFIRVGKFDNYVLYLFSGLLTWGIFTELGSRGISLVRQKRYLFESIQFKWIDVFTAACITTLIGTLFNFCAYFIMAAFLSEWPSIYIVWLPLLILNILFIGFGASMLLSAIQVYFKDIDHVWPVFVRAGFWTAPIFFPIEKIEELAPILIWIHPATPVIINVRNVLYYHQTIDVQWLLWGMFYAVIIIAVSYLILRFTIKNAFEKL